MFASIFHFCFQMLKLTGVTLVSPPHHRRVIFSLLLYEKALTFHEDEFKGKNLKKHNCQIKTFNLEVRMEMKWRSRNMMCATCLLIAKWCNFTCLRGYPWIHLPNICIKMIIVTLFQDLLCVHTDLFNESRLVKVKSFWAESKLTDWTVSVTVIHLHRRCTDQWGGIALYWWLIASHAALWCSRVFFVVCGVTKSEKLIIIVRSLLFAYFSMRDCRKTHRETEKSTKQLCFHIRSLPALTLISTGI